MEVLEVVLYVILTLILLALIGVLSWLIYDYYEYKKAVKSKIRETVAQSDDSNSLLKKDVTTDYDNKFSNTSNYILDSGNILRKEYINLVHNTSNILRPEYIDNIHNTSNLVKIGYIDNIHNTSNLVKTEYNTMFDNSSSNLNKFFSFGIHNDNSKINDKIHQRTWSLVSEIENLELIKNTIAKSNLTAEKLLTAKKGVKIQTNAGTVGPSSSTNYKGLEICDTSGERCWNLYVDGLGDLKAVKPNDSTNNTLSFTTLASLATPAPAPTPTPAPAPAPAPTPTPAPAPTPTPAPAPTPTTTSTRTT